MRERTDGMRSADSRSRRASVVRASATAVGPPPGVLAAHRLAGYSHAVERPSVLSEEQARRFNRRRLHVLSCRPLQ